MTTQTRKNAISAAEARSRSTTLITLSCITLFVPFFILLKVIPKFNSLFEKSRVTLPTLTKLTLGLSNWINDNIILALIMSVASLTLLGVYFFFSFKTNKSNDKLFIAWTISLIFTLVASFVLIVAAMYLPIFRMGNSF